MRTEEPNIILLTAISFKWLQYKTLKRKLPALHSSNMFGKQLQNIAFERSSPGLNMLNEYERKWKRIKGYARVRKTARVQDRRHQAWNGWKRGLQVMPTHAAQPSSQPALQSVVECKCERASWWRIRAQPTKQNHKSGTDHERVSTSRFKVTTERCCNCNWSWSWIWFDNSSSLLH